MGVKGSGELRFPDHNNESTGQDITEEFGPDGSGQVNLKDYYRGGSKVPNNSANTSVPDGSSGNTEISLKDFYNAQDNNLDGNLAGTTGSFSWTNIKRTGTQAQQFPLDINGTERDSNFPGFWEMLTLAPSNSNDVSDQSNAVGSIEICHDQANKRILILLLKDGTNAVPAGGTTGLNAGYKILPYIGLENATWTAKVEYNSNSNGYDSTNSTIGTYNGPLNQTASFSTSSTYHTVPTADTFLSIPTETGLSADGDTITNESTRVFTWIAQVPGNLDNYTSYTGSGTFGGKSTGARITIKAELGGETFQTVSAYWLIGLKAQKGFGF